MNGTHLDLKATQPTALVRLASVTLAVVGLMTVLCGVQITDLHFYRYPILGALPYVMMVGGVAQIALASQIYRVRPWAAYGGVAHGGSMALVLTFWAVYSWGLAFSCLLYITVPIAALALLLALAAIKPVRTAAAARARLAAEGLDLGI